MNGQHELLLRGLCCFDRVPILCQRVNDSRHVFLLHAAVKQLVTLVPHLPAGGKAGQCGVKPFNAVHRKALLLGRQRVGQFFDRWILAVGLRGSCRGGLALGFLQFVLQRSRVGIEGLQDVPVVLFGELEVRLNPRCFFIRRVDLNCQRLGFSGQLLDEQLTEQHVRSGGFGSQS